MRSFASDNNSSVHPRIMEALMKTNNGHALGYGDDPWTEEAAHKVKEQFSRPCEALFVFNGTGSNTMALQMMTRPYHIIFCADTAHIAVDECGAPSKATGCFMRTIPTLDGKLTPELLKPFMVNFGIEHHSQPGAIYLSQCSELGTIYKPEEICALTEFAHRHGLFVHMDGARISNAAAALGMSLDDISSLRSRHIDFGRNKERTDGSRMCHDFQSRFDKGSALCQKTSLPIGQQNALYLLPVHSLP